MRSCVRGRTVSQMWGVGMDELNFQCCFTTACVIERQYEVYRFLPLPSSRIKYRVDIHTILRDRVQFSHFRAMPVISSPSPNSPSSAPISSPNPPLMPLTIPIQHIYFLALIIAVSVAVFLLLRLLTKTPILRSPHLPTNKPQSPSRETETLRSIWPPATLIAAAPESKSLPTPTIRRHSYPDAENSPADPPPPPAQISHVQSWPRSGGLVQQETMEELNGCRRHVVVFGRRN